MTAEARFWSKVEPEPTSGCWIWTGADSAGYGRFWDGQRVVPAHRWSYEHFVGPLGDLEPDHLCFLPPCVNYHHMRPATHIENSIRWRVNGHAKKTHCPAGHEYTEDNIYRILSRPNARYCRACQAIRNRNRGQLWASISV